MKGKIYKKGVRYYSTKKNIYGLTIGNDFWDDKKYVVREDKKPFKEWWERETKVVYKGSLTDCRNYLKSKFKK